MSVSSINIEQVYGPYAPFNYLCMKPLQIFAEAAARLQYNLVTCVICYMTVNIHWLAHVQSTPLDGYLVNPRIT